MASNVDKFVTDAEHALINHTGIPGVGGGGSADAFPVGAIVPFGAAVASIPPGWRACDGTAVGRTGGDPDPEAALFLVIGTTWGIGDGATTYNLPDLRAKVVVGLNDGTLPAGQDGGFALRNLAGTGGAENVNHTHGVGSYAAGSGGSHSHTITVSPDPGTFLETNLSASYPGNDGLNGRHTHNASSNTTGAHGHGISGTSGSDNSSNLPPFAVATHIIKAQNVGGGVGGVSAQVNAGALEGPQPTLNFIPSGDAGVTVVENVGLNRLDVTFSATSSPYATMGFGAALNNPGNYARVNGTSIDTEDSALDEKTEAVSPIAGGTVTFTWHVDTTGATVRIFQNGSPVGSPVVLSTATGVSVQSIALVAGDTFAVEFQSGLNTGGANFHIHIGP